MDNVINIFQNYSDKKASLKSIIDKAFEYGWINSAKKDEFYIKLENDILTIGVIGQMKAGKSTFLNSFVFERDLLPSATTPMTAALSVITYGPTEELVVTFYDRDEWAEQKRNSERDPKEAGGNEVEKSKILAAKELVEKSKKLGSKITTLLGTTKTDTLDNLREYVGSDGRYVSITKSVEIHYPKEYLKGVRVVDTPGFNDPIVSREERTKEFLNSADVVLLMIYAGRPFDAKDREILFKNVKEVGVGKVIVAINKFDIPYEKGDTEDEIVNYVREQIEQAKRTENDPALNDILDDIDPLPISAEMALLSQLPMATIEHNSAYSHAFKRHCNIFEISTQNQMRSKSKIDVLNNLVEELIIKEKDKILFEKVLNSILAFGNLRKKNIYQSVVENGALLNALSLPDMDLQNKVEEIRRSKKKINRKLGSLNIDLKVQFRQVDRKTRLNLNDKWNEVLKAIEVFLKKYSRVKKIDKSILWRISQNINRYYKVTALSVLNDTEEAVQDIINTVIKDFVFSIKGELSKVFDDAASDKSIFDDFVKGFQEDIQINLIETLQNYKVVDVNKSYSFTEMNFVERIFLGNGKDELISEIDKINQEFTEGQIMNNFQEKTAVFSEIINKKVIKDVIERYESQLNTAVNSIDERNKQLSEAKSKEAGLNQELEKTKLQIDEIEKLKQELITECVVEKNITD